MNKDIVLCIEKRIIDKFISPQGFVEINNSNVIDRIVAPENIWFIPREIYLSCPNCWDCDSAYSSSCTFIEYRT